MKDYPDFLTTTGYGEADGLCGVNCCFPRKKAETTAKICEINDGKR